MVSLLRAVSTIIALFACSSTSGIFALSCNPPAPGTPVTIQPCTVTASQWAFNATTQLGMFSLKLNPSLCLGLGPIYQPSGSPSAILSKCDWSDYSQRWAFNILPGPTQLYNGLVGNVMDVFNNEVSPGTQVETYSPNGGLNQMFTWTSNGNLITSLDNVSCVAVC